MAARKLGGLHGENLKTEEEKKSLFPSLIKLRHFFFFLRVFASINIKSLSTSLELSLKIVVFGLSISFSFPSLHQDLLLIL